MKNWLPYLGSDNNPKMDRNQDIKEAAEIMTAIYDRGPHFRTRPACRIYYMTTGNWNADDKNLVGRREPRA